MPYVILIHNIFIIYELKIDCLSTVHHSNLNLLPLLLLFLFDIQIRNILKAPIKKVRALS